MGQAPLYISPHNPAATEVVAQLQAHLAAVCVVDTSPVRSDVVHRTSRRWLTRANTQGGRQGLAAMRGLTPGEASAANGHHWLLVLSPEVWQDEALGEQLATEVEAALTAGIRPVMVYAPEASSFSAIIDATPLTLKMLQLYDCLARRERGRARA